MTLDLKLDLTSELSDLDLNLTWVSSTLSWLKQGKQHWQIMTLLHDFIIAQPILTIIRLKYKYGSSRSLRLNASFAAVITKTYGLDYIKLAKKNNKF